MPTRKFSAETTTLAISAGDFIPVCRDPGGTPASRVMPFSALQSNVLAGTGLSPLVAVGAADFDTPVFLNGGSAGSVAIVEIGGETLGLVDDLIQLNITNTTLPGAGPLIISVPLILGGGVPDSCRFRWACIPGTPPINYSLGLMFTNAARGLYFRRERDTTPPGTLAYALEEIDAASASAARWDSVALPYADGEMLDVTVRKVSPFAASPDKPQFEIDMSILNYDPAATVARWIATPVGPTVGTFNDSGDWDTEDFDGLSLVFIASAAYAPTLTVQFQLRKDF